MKLYQACIFQKYLTESKETGVNAAAENFTEEDLSRNTQRFFNQKSLLKRHSFASWP